MTTTKSPVYVFEGSVAVCEHDYCNLCEDDPMEDLDRILTKSTRMHFVLTYPFDKPFAGVITGEITLRRVIDAIRAGFQTMYAGTTERDIPNLCNKDVTGPYGQAFHEIGDLVIERIHLCSDDSFSIFIGS